MANENLVQFTVGAASRHPRDFFSDAYDPKTHRYTQEYVSASAGWHILCDARAALTPTVTFLAKPQVNIGNGIDIFNVGDVFDDGGDEPPLPPLPPIVVPDNVVSYEWSYRQITGGNRSESVLKQRSEFPFSETSSLMAWHSFNVRSEGRYRFRLKIRLDDGSVLSSEQKLRLRDRLVVSIGDSYASGEGLPDVFGRTDNLSVLADQVLGSLGSIPGLGRFFDALNILNSGDEFCEQSTIAKMITSLIPFLVEQSNKTVGEILTLGTGDEVAELLQDLLEWTSEKTTGIGVEWQEPFAHRSYRSGPSAAAQALESLDKGDVVTFLSFARSGSTISGGLLGPREEDSAWNPVGQIEEIWQTVRNRQIDALLINVGGNDAGFARGLTALTKGDGLKFWAFATGGTAGLVGAIGVEALVPSREEVKRAALTAIDNLPEQFRKLSDAFTDLGIAPDRIYLTEYPESLFDDPRTEAGVQGECGIFNGGPGLSIDTEDALAIREIAHALNTKLLEIAGANGWNFIEGIADGFAGHGYCSEKSFYVFAEESCRKQGDFEGMMHPTADGAKVYSKRIADTLRRRLFPREFDLDSPDVPQPGGEATGETDSKPRFNPGAGSVSQPGGLATDK
jgi:lysophospholipase L1-like esterase